MAYPVLIKAEQIQNRLAELAKQIESDFPSPARPLLFVGVLKGSFIFLADLVRKLSVPLEIDFLEVSSYGDAMESSGEAKILKDLRSPIEGRDLILVEDIVDTGTTLTEVIKTLEARSPKSISVCSLLHKPSREKIKVPISYLGFTIDDHFVVGYGLDVAEAHRQLKDIVIYQPPTS